ncbi:histidine phosphatase family protein [Halodesulfovibrio aestuarii]|uniref:phosphoglycerate mutase (2,3-diphosphoglycerate-dependent) n=1 Tax=Halodesulfovibrio aestuarii TaxID=126333 RepID=A0ABV4JS24_9BACT
MKQTYIGLLRHAPTGWNSVKRIQGQHDVSLPQESYDIINEWIPSIMHYPWTRILTSDLARAYHTALALNKHTNVPIERDSRLREQDWGAWAGHTIQDLRETTPEEIARQEAAGWDFKPPGGESRIEVLNRTLEAMHEATRRWDGEHILIVTHYGNIASIANHLMHTKFLPEEGKLIKKHALHRLIAEQTAPETTQYSILSLNEVI